LPLVCHTFREETTDATTVRIFSSRKATSDEARTYGDQPMKKQYDFPRAERGKFYRADARLNLPVYLDEEVPAFVQGIAEKRHADLSAVVNQLLRSDMQLAETLR
jgi:hypothetical protein